MNWFKDRARFYDPLIYSWGIVIGLVVFVVAVVLFFVFAA